MDKLTLAMVLEALQTKYDVDYILDMWNADQEKAKQFYLDHVNKYYGITLGSILKEMANPSKPLTKEEHQAMAQAIMEAFDKIDKK